MTNDSISPAEHADRRTAISKAGDGGKAINEALGVFYSIKSLAEILRQDTVRDNDAWVLGIAHSLVEHAEVMIEFLDRPMGWPELDDESADKVANRINHIAADRDLTAQEARDGLHAETVREIRREYPHADEREHKLRVAIRESTGMTPEEEERAYELISAAVQS